MKRLLSIVLAALLLITAGVTSASAYTLPDGLWISDSEGDYDEVSGSGITGICYGYLGDSNTDMTVNIKDTTAIQKHIAELDSLTATGVILGDVDFSGEVNIKDATIIQKWLADIEVDSPIFHTLCLETNTDEEIIGTWETITDFSDIINATLIGESDDPLMAEYVNISEFNLKGITTFYFDGTCTNVVDREYLSESILLLKAELASDLYNYFDASFKAMGLNITVEYMLEYMGFASMEDYVDTIITDETVEYIAQDSEGTYYAADGKLYFDDNDNFEYYTIEGDTLTLTGNALGTYPEMYPVTYHRIDG